MDLLDNPPAASSSEEYESGSDESEPTEPSQPQSMKPEPVATKPLPLPLPQASSSSGETETDSESESEEEAVSKSPAPGNPVAAKANSKPADAPMSPAKSQSAAAIPAPANSQSAEASPAPAKSQPAAGSLAKSGTKRAAAAEIDANEAKKAKMLEVDESNKASGKLFQRIWNDEDEVVILKGMRDYAKKGMNPYADMAAFLAFIQNSLSFVVSKSQLQDKIRRFKKKFENNLGKKQKPTKPHELNTFQLSMKVWAGGENYPAGKSEQPMTNGKAKSKTPKEGTSKTTPKASGSGLGKVFGFDKGFKEIGLSENIMKQGLDLLDDSERAELKERWNKLHVAEMQLYSMRLELMLWETKLILSSQV